MPANLVGPKGDRGEKGERGEQGARGSDASPLIKDLQWNLNHLECNVTAKVEAGEAILLFSKYVSLWARVKVEGAYIRGNFLLPRTSKKEHYSLNIVSDLPTDPLL